MNNNQPPRPLMRIPTSTTSSNCPPSCAMVRRWQNCAALRCRSSLPLAYTSTVKTSAGRESIRLCVSQDIRDGRYAGRLGSWNRWALSTCSAARINPGNGCQTDTESLNTSAMGAAIDDAKSRKTTTAREAMIRYHGPCMAYGQTKTMGHVWHKPWAMHGTLRRTIRRVLHRAFRNGRALRANPKETTRLRRRLSRAEKMRAMKLNNNCNA